VDALLDLLRNVYHLCGKRGVSALLTKRYKVLVTKTDGWSRFNTPCTQAHDFFGRRSQSPATPRGSFARKTLGTASEHRPHLEDLERHRGPSQKQLRVNRDLVSSNTVTG